MANSRRVPVILFLIADTGGGHRSAANAIHAAMDLIAPEAIPADRSNLLTVDVTRLPFRPRDLLPPQWGGATREWHAEIHDIFQECGRYPLGQMVNLYGPTVEMNPRVYASIWHATNTRPTYSALSTFTQTMLRQGLVELFGRLRPDVVVSVHPLLTRPTLHILRELGVRVPFLTVVTDMVRFHRAWCEPEVDAISVPTDAARDLIIEQGMPAEKIHLLGMPIHPKYCMPPVDRGPFRQSLNLEPDRMTVLLVGGGEGVGGIGEAARAIAASGLPLQQIVITGRNRVLLERLQVDRLRFGIPTAVTGFVQNMPAMMHAADVIITKAGPGTIAEAMACGLPIILTGAIPGQEVGNIDYVIDQGVGMLATTPDEIVATLRKLAVPNSPDLARMRERALALSNPRAAFDIAQMILRELPSARAISPWSQPRRQVSFLRRRRVGSGQRRRFLRPVRRLLRLSTIRRIPLLIRRRARHLRNP